MIWAAYDTSAIEHYYLDKICGNGSISYKSYFCNSENNTNIVSINNDGTILTQTSVTLDTLEQRVDCYYPNGTLKWEFEPSGSYDVLGTPTMLANGSTLISGVLNRSADGFGQECIIGLDENGLPSWQIEVFPNFNVPWNTVQSPIYMANGSIYIDISSTQLYVKYASFVIDHTEESGLRCYDLNGTLKWIHYSNIVSGGHLIIEGNPPIIDSDGKILFCERYKIVLLDPDGLVLDSYSDDKSVIGCVFVGYGGRTYSLHSETGYDIHTESLVSFG